MHLRFNDSLLPSSQSSAHCTIMDAFYSLNTILISANCTNQCKVSPHDGNSQQTLSFDLMCLKSFPLVPFYKACAMVFPNTAPCMLAKLPLHHKINHKKRIWTKEPISPDKKVIYWQPSQFIQAGVHWGRQLFLVSLGVVAFPTLHLLPEQGSSYTPCQGLGLSWRAPSSPQPSFQHFPKFPTRPSVSRTSSAPAEKKKMSPGHPTHVRKLA